MKKKKYFTGETREKAGLKAEEWVFARNPERIKPQVVSVRVMEGKWTVTLTYLDEDPYKIGQILGSVHRPLQSIGELLARLMLAVLLVGLYVAPFVAGIIGSAYIGFCLERVTNGGFVVGVVGWIISAIFVGFYVAPHLDDRLSAASKALAFSN